MTYSKRLSNHFFLTGFVFILLTSVFFASYFEMSIFYLPPVLLIGAFLTIVDVRMLFYITIAVLPFTVEIYLSNGLGIDLLTEPLMMLISVIGIILCIRHGNTIRVAYFTTPISLLLILHLIWLGFTSVLSTNYLISIKFLLAKFWYIIPFYALPFWIFSERINYKIFIRILMCSVVIACLYVWYNHALEDFSFKSINESVSPVFRNHVNYAFTLLMITPFYFFYFQNFKPKGIWKTVYICLGLFILVSIIFSFTRAAIIALVIAALSYYIIKLRLVSYAIVISVIITAVMSWQVIDQNRFIQFAPDYERAITHENFDNLLEATAKGEDISTMERLHRWVAGYYMVRDRPLIGFGPGCYYSSYREYALNLFKTYVSDNPDKSGIHNYYFMTMVEQGIFGLLIFLSLCIYALIRGQQLYHLHDGFDRHLILTALILLILILTIILINDMLEAIKVGSFFFLSLSIIARYDIKTMAKGLR